MLYMRDSDFFAFLTTIIVNSFLLWPELNYSNSTVLQNDC